MLALVRDCQRPASPLLGLVLSRSCRDVALVSSAVHRAACVFVTMVPVQPRGASTISFPSSCSSPLCTSAPELVKQTSFGWHCKRGTGFLGRRSRSPGEESNDIITPAVLLSVRSVPHTCEVHCILPTWTLYPHVVCGLEARIGFMEVFPI